MQYGVPFPLFRGLGEELNALIQITIPEKTKIARKYGIKNFKGKKNMNLKYQSDSFARRIIAGVWLALANWIN